MNRTPLPLSLLVVLAGCGAPAAAAPPPVPVSTAPAAPAAPVVGASGRLPAETIQRIVRAAFPQLRACYERGLAQDPKLAGTVVTRFVIRRDGLVEDVNAVTSPEDGDFAAWAGVAKSDLPAAAREAAVTTLQDREVIACVIKGFRALTFPRPEAGSVTVVYPVTFSP